MKIDGLDVIWRIVNFRFLPRSNMNIDLGVCVCRLWRAKSLNTYFMRAVMKTKNDNGNILYGNNNNIKRREYGVRGNAVTKSERKRSAISQNENTDILFASGLL